MEKKIHGTDNREVLNIISELLNRVGLEKSVLTKDVKGLFESKIKNEAELEIIDTLLLQIQTINEKLENVNWMNKHYRILHEFAQVCSKTLNESVLLLKAYEMVSQVMRTDSFYIALYNDGDSHTNFIFIMDNGEQAPPRRVELGENYTTKVIRTREIVHLKQQSKSQEYHAKMGEGEIDTSSCLFVPIVIDDHVKGVISAQSTADFAFRKEHEELLQMIGAQVINSIETARLYEKIYTMSQTDELTRLKNHRAFHNDLSKLIEEGNQEITLIMIDSDNLKRINDNYGHDIGDLYLKILANGIKDVSCNGIEGYRYAGDEFMIIMKSEVQMNIKDLFEKLQEYYMLNPIVIFNKQITVSISSGVGVYPQNGLTVDSLKKAVDEALYEAKEQGKNFMVVAK
ncbi:sensor domain-containing diguanylate cyclase [Ferdinandcohnia quinoae]|uniref:Sensor domain-containing diguanylate cyclase n=1 Tax=Fredinandcohnia quinoae TaxID=2918902 RepID=A0AAW5E3D2_9BACI|nr:sensor domain-containing diguanylate cyclase [Fredinandcohnia sp. SECRCQ15]MCH1624597.1 sensor domain-containing diguanylate cyclase [Fredinandcohnia sp. SECRCQ15]